MRWLSILLVMGIIPVFMACEETPCESPKALDDGIDECASGLRARRVAETCESALPRADHVCEDDSGAGGCKLDSDCSESPLGICIQGVTGIGFTCSCGYGCAVDDDCGAGAACLCGGVVGSCVAAECRTNTDCGDGSVCAEWETSGDGCVSVKALACTSDEDACRTNAECPSDQLCLRRNGHAECGTQIDCA